jgi:hypothetical protein
MWDIVLTLAASLTIQPAQPQGQPQTQPQAATLESCEFVDERWVCRYRLPDIQLVDGGSAPPVPVPLPQPVPAPTSPDPGVLSQAETELVARCADAGWVSLCFPAQRTEARRLRDQARAYDEARQRVGVLIGEGDCRAALTFALNGGYLGLARESQGLCVSGSGQDQ